MHESDRTAGRAIRSAEQARDALMRGDTSKASGALVDAITTSAGALRLLGHTVTVTIDGEER